MSARGSSYIKRPFDFLLVVIEDKRVNYGAFSLLLKRRQRKCTPKPTDTEVVYVPLKRVPTTTGHVSCLSIKKDLGWHIWGHTEHNFFWQYTLISDKSNMAFFYWLSTAAAISSDFPWFFLTRVLTKIGRSRDILAQNKKGGGTNSFVLLFTIPIILFLMEV